MQPVLRPQPQSEFLRMAGAYLFTDGQFLLSAPGQIGLVHFGSAGAP
jgi:hypothetical protein